MVTNVTSTGGDGKIYKCTVAHTVVADGSNHTFTAANWTEIAEAVTEMTLADRIEATKQVLEATYNLEIEIKSNVQTNKSILIKKLLVDICELANAS